MQTRSFLQRDPTEETVAPLQHIQYVPKARGACIRRVAQVTQAQ